MNKAITETLWIWIEHASQGDKGSLDALRTLLASAAKTLPDKDLITMTQVLYDLYMQALEATHE